jgi:acyl-CoA synthetase (NDP forming)
MLRTVREHAPDARIDGFLVQPMITGGTELIVGVSRDVQFGPVLMLGLGGIYAEALSAAAWRLCPVTRREAHEMIAEIKGLPQILGAFRGRLAADVDAVIDTLVKVSGLAVASADQVESIDINPLVVLPRGQGAIAVDACIVPAT